MIYVYWIAAASAALIIAGIVAALFGYRTLEPEIAYIGVLVTGLGCIGELIALAGFILKG